MSDKFSVAVNRFTPPLVEVAGLYFQITRWDIVEDGYSPSAQIILRDDEQTHVLGERLTLALNALSERG